MDFHIVDVFAEEKYQGNQLAVFIPDRALSTEEMLAVAREIHFSETTFVRAGRNADGSYEARIFTPDGEIPFAGHPVLGTAFVINRLWENSRAARVWLSLPVGLIPVDIEGDQLTMSQNQPEFGPIIQQPELLAQALSLKAEDLAPGPVQVVSTGLPCVVAGLKNVRALAGCLVDHPRFRAWLAGPADCNLLVFVEDRSAPSPTLRVRVFLNDSGYFEDPATGSANGNLAAYLLKHGLFGRDKIEYQVRQGVEMGRPSLMHVSAELSQGRFKIRVGGRVQPVASGRWF